MSKRSAPDLAEHRRDLLKKDRVLRARARRLLSEGADGPDGLELDALIELCIGALGRPDADLPSVGRLIVELQDLELRLREHDLVTGTVRLAQAERGLARLRACTNLSTLLDAVCPEVTRSCGFARVLLSRVEHGHWYPWQVNNAVAGEPWVAAWSSNAIPLSETIREGRLLHEHRPALINDVNAADIHPVIRASGAHSYVVAPIVPAGRVLGFLHADHSGTGPPCDDTDRDILWRFAEGFGHLYERTALLEQMRAQRTRIRELLDGIDASMAQLTEAEVELGTCSPAARPTTPADATAGLTARQKEVLELVLAGAGNAEIAERLVIGEGTVKTHIKQILVKLGAVNRAQLIGRFLKP